jgi:hypothetical protein
MLWDSSNDYDPNQIPVLTIESGPKYFAGRIEDRSVYDYEMNHVLPFYEDPSSGSVVVGIYTEHPLVKSVIRQALMVPVKVLAGFASKMGTIEFVPWQEWQKFATPIEPDLISSPSGILHSRVLSVHPISETYRSTSMVRICDFSLGSRRRRKPERDMVLPPYAVLEFPLDSHFHGSSFEFTEGGVLVTTVSAHPISVCGNTDPGHLQEVKTGGVERYFWAV